MSWHPWTTILQRKSGNGSNSGICSEARKCPHAPCCSGKGYHCLLIFMRLGSSTGFHFQLYKHLPYSLVKKLVSQRTIQNKTRAASRKKKNSLAWP
jgi:hypothetical protein